MCGPTLGRKRVKRILRQFALSLLLLWAASASAALPDSGWYWNSAEPGRGFILEIQNNTLFISGFLYDTLGNQIWVYSGGVMSSDRTYSGPAYRTTSGQRLGGTYQAATNVPFGTATITFTSTVTANVSINGYNFGLTRFVFGVDYTDYTNFLLGEFAFVLGSPSVPLYFGQRVTFTRTQLLNGSVYAVGNITGATESTNLAIGRFVPNLQRWTVLIDSSPSYYQYYVFDFAGFNFTEGDESTYLKTESPNGTLNVIGTRVKSAQAATGANAPGTQKVMPRLRSVEIDAENASRAAMQVPNELDTAHLDSLRELERVLLELKAYEARQ